ncbi:MAG: DUF1501 domain-containing protein [Verrucomicrobiota bacterium]
MNLYIPQLPKNAIDHEERRRHLTRRTFLERSGANLGGLALAGLVSGDALGTQRTSGKLTDGLSLPQRAKRVIHLCMAGGPSHLETFDHKPKLAEIDGEAFPESFTRGQQLAQLQGAELKARGPVKEFQQHGQSGQIVSGYFPHIGSIADDICVIRSMHTEQINHDPAHAFMNTGSTIKGRPSMGSWLLYGLGAESEELPGFVVMHSHAGRGGQPVSARQWSSGFLPSKYQGIQFQSQGDAVHYVGNPGGVCQSTQRQVIEEVQALNGMLSERRHDPEIDARIAQYEMAFRMQSSVPQLTDLQNEPQHVLDLYGVKSPGDGSFASNCLLARRMAERGVRFIQLYHRGWDHHNEISKFMEVSSEAVDRASAALILDLKQRGMLDDTLVIWGGEFGRTPMGQGTGRDHHINAFSIWMAGGGVKGGMSWGQTDELGYKFIDNDEKMHVHDLHATLLHLFGIDHEQFTHRFQGRDFRLTDVHGHVAKGIIA